MTFFKRNKRFLVLSVYHNRSSPTSINVGESSKASDNMVWINIALGVEGSRFLPNQTKYVNLFFVCVIVELKLPLLHNSSQICKLIDVPLLIFVQQWSYIIKSLSKWHFVMFHLMKHETYQEIYVFTLKKSPVCLYLIIFILFLQTYSARKIIHQGICCQVNQWSYEGWIEP